MCDSLWISLAFNKLYWLASEASSWRQNSSVSFVCLPLTFRFIWCSNNIEAATGQKGGGLKSVVLWQWLGLTSMVQGSEWSVKCEGVKWWCLALSRWPHSAQRLSSVQDGPGSVRSMWNIPTSPSSTVNVLSPHPLWRWMCHVFFASICICFAGVGC